MQSNSNASDDTEDDSEWLEDELELNLEENGIVEVMHGVSDADNSFANLASNATQGPPSKKQKHGHSNGGPSKQQQGGEHEQEQPAMQEQLQGGAQGQEQPAKQKQEQEQRQGASQANSSKAWQTGRGDQQCQSKAMQNVSAQSNAKQCHGEVGRAEHQQEACNTQMQKQQQEQPSTGLGKIRNNLDDEFVDVDWELEKEGNEDPLEEPWDEPPEESRQCELENSSGASSSQNPKGPAVRRRISGKTKPSLTRYADIVPLASKAKARGRKRKNADICKSNKAIRASERAEAMRFVSLQSDLSTVPERHQDDSNIQEVDWEFADRIHNSHRIKAVGGNQEAIYCCKCGGWNAGGPLRTLRDPCRGHVTQARTYQHRLLSLGIIPSQGSKVPSHRRW